MKGYYKKSVLLFLLLLFPILYSSCVDEQVVDSSGNADKGNIYVQSEPKGAEIYFLGSSTGKFTPDSLMGIDKGTYEITLKRKDFFDSTFTVTVAGNLNITKFVILKSLIGTGDAYITSQPSGASIYLNGNNSSKITPDSLNGLAEGTYQLTLKLADYYDTTVNVKILRDQLTIRDVALTKIPPPPKSSITVNSTPSGARIYLSGSNTGKNTPDSFTGLDAGSYNFTLKLTGYRDTSFTASVSAGQNITRNITLTRVVLPPPKVTIGLASIPSGASILMNGNSTGKSTPDSISNIDPGVYSFTLKLSGYLDTTISVNAGSAGRYDRIITMRKIPVKKNSIYLETVPPGAEIYLNGRNTGILTPGTVPDLDDGTYTVTLKHNGFHDTTISVTLAGGVNKTYSIRLIDTQPTPEVSLDYQVTFLGQLLVTFSFSRDVLLDEVSIINPDNETTTGRYGGQKISKDEKKTLLILKSMNGTWSFKFTGKNASGTQNSFSVTGSIKVKD